MTPIADMIEQMVAGGVAMDMILVAVRAAEMSSGVSTRHPPDSAAEKRRAWDRAYRAKKRSVHPNPPDIPPDTENALYLSSSPSNLESEKKEKKERKRGEKIPPDWKPTPEHMAEGQKLGYSESQILEQAEDMRLWAQSNEHRAVARKSNWNSTFSGWLRRNKPKRQGSGAVGKPSMSDALGKLREAEESLRRGDGGIHPTWPPPLRVISNR